MTSEAEQVQMKPTAFMISELVLQCKLVAGLGSRCTLTSDLAMTARRLAYRYDKEPTVDSVLDDLTEVSRAEALIINDMPRDEKWVQYSRAHMQLVRAANELIVAKSVFDSYSENDIGDIS